MSPRTGRVVFVGGPTTLRGAERSLARRGIRVDRVVALEGAPVDPVRLRGSLARFGAYDVLLVTSKEAVRAMAATGAFRRVSRGARSREVVAGGPSTARALASRGIRAHWTAADGVGAAVARRFARARPLRIVYARSDRAGPGLAQALRREGHTVLDLVAYRLVPGPRLSRPAQDKLLRADRVLTTSPSALSYLARALRPESFVRLRRRRTIVVLGPKSARSARGHGFRQVRIVPDVTDRAVGEFLGAELTDAR